jgi:type I restriction enzyme S subunit
MAEVPAGWHWMRLADLAVEKGLVGGPFGSSLVKADYTDRGIPVIRGANLSSDGRFDSSDFVFVSEDKYQRDLARNSAEPGDVVFTQRGTLGQVGLVPSEPFDRYVVSQSQMRLRTDPSVVLAEYVYYAFRSRTMVDQILRHAIATGVPHINLGILSGLQVLVPPLEDQERICGLLRALDDKIELNRRMAHCAHQAVRLAQMELTGTAGVRSVPLGDVAVVNAAVLRRADLPPVIRYLDISSVRPDEIVGWQMITPEEAPGRARRGLRPGDSVISTVRPGRRSHAWVWRPPQGAVGSTGLAVVSPAAAGPALVYATISSDAFISYLESVAEGSAYPAVKADMVARGPAFTGPTEVLARFEEVNLPLLERAAAAAEESRTLASLRDSLLPRLLSGELQVREATEQVGVVG